MFSEENVKPAKERKDKKLKQQEHWRKTKKGDDEKHKKT